MIQSTTSTITVSLPPRFKHGIRLVARRYVAADLNPDGVTLLFFHCTGSHKEVFEPTITNLLSLKHPVKGTSVVREAWAFDNPSHGEASSQNDQALRQQDIGFTVDEWSDCFKMFYASGTFEGHKLVPIGHSSGSTAVLLATMSGALPAVPFKSLILIEPSLITRAAWNEHEEQQVSMHETISSMVLKRRDTWADRADARRYFEARLPWSMWDAHVLDLFVQHGLKGITPAEGGEQANKVTLCCSRMQEYTQYTKAEPHFIAAERVGTLDPSVRVHFILGEREDIIPEYCHNSAMELRPIASLQRVPDAGHFVVQENPDGLALAIGRILTGQAVPRAAL